MPSLDADAPFIERFINEYLKDLNGTAAARRANPSLKAPHSAAYTILQREDVQARLAQAHAERNARVGVEADNVLREIHAIAMADTNEIVQVRRGCCRRCHGIEHRHQYTDQDELERARTDFHQSEAGLVDPFLHGGVGFDPKLGPVGSCPGCGGEGGAYVHINDTRDLSPAARALFAGAKQTKDGIEVKLHSKEKHLEMLARHLGLLKDKVEISGDAALIERITRGRKRVGG